MYPSCLSDYHNNNTYHFEIPQENYYYHSSPFYIPLEDEAVFSDFFQQQNFLSTDTSILAHDMNSNYMESTMEECSNNNGQVDVNTYLEPENSTPTKRPSKRDRHSKINTARGPRDRRMRLSLDVAKKLFGLQDLLGFDKASKTVDWLITKSETAILELFPAHSCSFMGVSNSASCSSECEVLSGARAADQPMVVIETGDDQETMKNKEKSSFESIKKPKEKGSRGVRRCVDFHHPVAKATRERARERARERTTEKRNNKHKSIGRLEQAMDQNVTQLRSWSPFEENRLERIDQVDQMSSNLHIKQGFVNDNSSMFMMGNWNPSYMFNYQHTSGLTHEHQFNEYRITGKAWEVNNN